MLTCSESIGALAAALARAQQELTNPEKSLTATLTGVTDTVEGRTFRYASLASGLDIVRKSLGRQEIAAVQTTAIDQNSGLVRLTTTLAHSSGEWVSSEWPVCPVAEMADPQRMGAALTYARRYALFTLVGIAGEDDLDAPAPKPQAKSLGNGHSSQSTSSHGANDMSSARRSGWSPRSRAAPKAILSSDASSTLREQLLASVAALNSAEALTQWAKDSMPAKNTLADADVRVVETAFEARRSELGEPIDASVDLTLNKAAEAVSPSLATDAGRSADRGAPHVHVGPPHPVTRGEENGETDRAGSSVVGSTDIAGPPARARQRTAIDKSALTFDEPKRIRDKEHLRHVAAQPCVLCSARPAEAHHIRFAQPRALGRKVSDQFTVPLCRKHHRDVHHSGNEAAWWHDMGIDPIDIALQLWDETLIARGFVTPPLLLSDLPEGSKQA
jgi:hypothetical protein